MTLPPTTAQWQAFVRDRDPRLRDAIILSYARLVRGHAAALAARLPAWVDIQDLQSSGLEGLVHAVDRYDPSRGVRFETFAAAHVVGRMLDELRRLDWVPRSVRERAQQTLRLVPLDTPASDQRDCSLSELVEDAHAEQPEHSSVRAELRKVLDASFDELPARDALILRLHYYDELTLAEIGELLGVSPSRTHGIHQRSLHELQAALEGALGSGGVDSSGFSDAA